MKGTGSFFKLLGQILTIGLTEWHSLTKFDRVFKTSDEARYNGDKIVGAIIAVYALAYIGYSVRIDARYTKRALY